MYMRPSALAPAGRSMVHSGKAGSMVSKGVSMKYENSSRMYGTEGSAPASRKATRRVLADIRSWRVGYASISRGDLGGV